MSPAKLEIDSTHCNIPVASMSEKKKHKNSRIDIKVAYPPFVLTFPASLITLSNGDGLTGEVPIFNPLTNSVDKRIRLLLMTFNQMGTLPFLRINPLFLISTLKCLY